jgi:hypothetical protein
MDSDVRDVLKQLECVTESPIDETADSPVEGDERDSIDELWIDIGGEG